MYYSRWSTSSKYVVGASASSLWDFAAGSMPLTFGPTKVEPLREPTIQCKELREKSVSLVQLYLSVRTGQQAKSDVKPGYALRVIEMAEIVETRYISQFDDMCRRLTITQSGAYSTFLSVCGEVFRSGINWGRLAGFFAFGGALVDRCIEKSIPNAVEQVTDWMNSYLEENLLAWIDSKGGWEGFEQHFGPSESPSESKGYLTSGIKKIIAVGCVGAVFLMVTASK